MFLRRGVCRSFSQRHDASGVTLHSLVYCEGAVDPPLDDVEIVGSQLARIIRYLRGTKDLTLQLRADNLNIVKWWVDGAFAVHEGMKSHTGGVMSLGKGSAYSASKKKKLIQRAPPKRNLSQSTTYYIKRSGRSTFLKGKVMAQTQSCMKTINLP